MFEVLKDWGSHKKGDTIELKDKTVIEQAIKTGVIKEKKSK